MILNASAENFSSSDALRSADSPLSSSPLTGGMSTGDGRKSITASSMRCTPLFLKAVPHSIGWISQAMVRSRSALTISARVSSSPPRYFSISASLASAADSTIFSRHSLQVATSSAGMSVYSNFTPWLASSQMIAFISSRSTTPWKPSSAPIGTTTGTGLAFRRVFSWS